jgi:NitT/TauT family transport system substrate-binding protein
MSVAPPDIKLIAPGRDALPNYVRLCLTLTGKTIASRRDDAIHFLAAQIAALRFAVSHRDETIALTRERTGLKGDDKRAPYVFDVSVKHHDVDPEIAIPMDKLDWMQRELVKTGNLKQAGDLGKIVDPSLRAKALELVGK